MTLCFNKHTNITVESHTRTWRSSYVEFLPYIRSCHPSNFYGASFIVHLKIPNVPMYSCLCPQSYSSSPCKFILHSIADLFLACSSRPTTLILRCLVLSGLFKLPHASFFSSWRFLSVCVPRCIIRVVWCVINRILASDGLSHLHSRSGTDWIS